MRTRRCWPNTVDKVIETARADMANFQIHKALAAIIDVVADGDRYFASQEPWALKKTDPARMETVLYVTAETVRQISILLQPFMPRIGGQTAGSGRHSCRQARFQDAWRTGRLEARHADRQADRRSFRAMSRPRRVRRHAG
jgi:methionyl-tRNA synthetase